MSNLCLHFEENNGGPSPHVGLIYVLGITPTSLGISDFFKFFTLELMLCCFGAILERSSRRAAAAERCDVDEIERVCDSRRRHCCLEMFTFRRADGPVRGIEAMMKS